MSLKRRLMDRAYQLAQDPRVNKALQDPRVWEGVAGFYRLKDRLGLSMQELAKQLDLVPAEEVRELRATVERLQHELDEERARNKPAPKRPRKVTARATKQMRRPKDGAETSHLDDLPSTEVPPEPSDDASADEASS
jgi:hypothetical protein